MEITEIKIADKTYNLKPSAYSMFVYRNIFNKSLYSDATGILLTMMGASKSKKSDDEILGEIVETITRILYVFIVEEERPKSYKEFMEGISRISITEGWIFEAITLIERNFSL